MKTSFAKSDRRRRIERRKYHLTIHFPDRRSGRNRRIRIDRRVDELNRRKNGEERRMGV
jgi:hypothetical protein